MNSASTDCQALVAVTATLVSSNDEDNNDDVFCDEQYPYNDVPIASAVLADWEEHQAYAASVLQEALVLDTFLEQQTAGDDEVDAIVISVTPASNGQARLRPPPPKDWRPWSDKDRERFAVLAEALLELQERLSKSQEEWQQRQSPDTESGILDADQAYQLSKLDQQSQKVGVWRMKLESTTRLPPGHELNLRLQRLEKDLFGQTKPMENDLAANYPTKSSLEMQYQPRELQQQQQEAKCPCACSIL
eukprot:CAMPEP_0197448394 /NCGR_PEP_ID=MMETSP1175-20131217/17203_1 /TAXON_ID=1003142 /ORGANISM="Triceratium dubium, Strain CCMP147" /LENGTH=246 /DNA_ID=CAMNT_0042980123 /DNA_START=56 /DNA_END=796 /DNA_ORIENTATION=-